MDNPSSAVRSNPGEGVKEQVAVGLEGVLAGTSAVCEVNGEKGELYYRGYSIHELAIHSTFEEVAYLLLFEDLPSKSQLSEFSRQLSTSREVSSSIERMMRIFPIKTPPMTSLRTAISALGMFDPDLGDNSRESNVRKSIRLIGQLATVVAYADRLRKDAGVVPPRADLSHAANFVYMLTGKEPDHVATRAFDVALILHADHEFNASTFAARQTASTLADMHAAITSAIGTLEGPLHGGANQEVMKMLLEIGEPGKVEEYIASALGQKKKIPGFGHRVYKAEDPRATHLRKMAEELGKRVGESKWHEMLKKAEEVVWSQKKLYSNVDLYSAAVYHTLGIATDLFTPIFAVSRISGWCAHALEQYGDNKLIRPRAEYTGARDRHYVPLSKRA